MNPVSPHSVGSRVWISGALSALVLAGLFALPTAARAQSVNHRPTISWIPDQRITSGSFAQQDFTVGDFETAAGSLTITKASSNTSWLPVADIVLGGSGANRTVSISPTPSTNGAATVTLTVTDGGGKSTATSFTLRKAASGTAPVIQGVANETIVVNSSYGSLPLVVKDQDTSEGALTLSASSSNTTLVPNNNITFGGQNWGRTVTVTPATNQTGRAVITLTVSDGSNPTDTSFVLDVVSGNSPPTITDLATFQTIELGDTSPGLAFTVTDTETAANNLLVTGTSSNTSLVANNNIAITTTGSTRTVTLTPASGVAGTTTITLAISDGDIIRRTTYLYVVEDPEAPAAQFNRSRGVFILDSAGGSNYTTSFGKSIELRDANMRDLPFVTGFVLRVGWDDVESSTTAGQYDFHIIENALDLLPDGQDLSIIITPDEPAYIASTGGVVTWNDGGTTRPVPWAPYLRTRRDALLAAMAAFEVDDVPLAEHPRIVLLDPYLPGGHTGIRNPNNLNLSAMSGYSRQNLLEAVQDELRALQDNFPGKLVQIGFWKVQDSEDASYGGLEAWDWIRQQLLAEFDGSTRPRAGFFMENLAAKRAGPAVDPYSATPITSFGQALYDSRDDTWTAFQMLGNWTRPFNDNHVNNTLNGTPNDAIEYGFNTYYSQYSEVYITDIDNAAMQPALQSWHDYLASLAGAPPLDAPTGLTATPVSSSQINLSWNTVSGATGYELQQQTGGGSFTTIYIGATAAHNDTGLTASTQYTYRVRATASGQTSAWSGTVSATTQSGGGGGDVTSGRVGWWKLDETGSATTATDSSGNNNDGALSGFSGTYWVNGQLGNGLDFDGADDVVNAGSGGSLDNMSGVTVTAWIRPSSNGEGGFGRVAQKGNGTSPSAGFWFQLRGTGQIEFRAAHASANLVRLSDTNAIAYNTWQHVAVTWDGSTAASNVHLYVDGDEVTYATTTNGSGARTDDSATNVYVGNIDAQSRTFDGIMDDVRVYDRALSAGEIDTVYNFTGDPPPAAPTGLSATAVSTSQIDLSWNTVSGATSYELQHQPAGGSFSTIYTGATASHNDTGLSANTQYTYRVRATGSGGTSDWSSTASATTFSSSTQTLTVQSQAANDGYVTASSATDDIGNSSGIRAGEGSNSNQQKGIVSFDTSALPDTATIVSVTLRLKQGNTDAGFTTLGTCMVDIRNGDFNGNQALESADFSATASATNVGEVTGVGQNNWAEVELSSAALSQVNKTGRTQLRIYFNNHTSSNTNVTWYPGESAGNQPELVIDYQ